LRDQFGNLITSAAANGANFELTITDTAGAVIPEWKGTAVNGPLSVGYKINVADTYKLSLSFQNKPANLFVVPPKNVVVQRYSIVTTADNAFDLYVGGNYIGSGANWVAPYTFTPAITLGRDVRASQRMQPWGLSAHLRQRADQDSGLEVRHLPW
jgi:hypothetical protein